MDILSLFRDIDDFCRLFEPAWRRRRLASGAQRRHKPSALALSEIMTILVLSHASGYRDFKTFYTRHVTAHLAGAFPKLVSYGRFVELRRDPLWCYLHTRKGSCTGVALVDTTTLAVCHNLRIRQHKVFWDSARRGQSSMGWFYGFKLHLVINECGELLGCYLTPGNVDDRRPVPHMVRALWGKLFGDKGCISQPLAALLEAQELRRVTRLKKNMKNKFLALTDKLLLRKRALIETVNDQLRNISRFNGATSSRTWKQAVCTRDARAWRVSLQWSHVLTDVETGFYQWLKRNRIVASMEPRPHGRGNNGGQALPGFAKVWLQWSHVLTDVETSAMCGTCQR